MGRKGCQRKDDLKDKLWERCKKKDRRMNKGKQDES